MTTELIHQAAPNAGAVTATKEQRDDDAREARSATALTGAGGDVGHADGASAPGGAGLPRGARSGAVRGAYPLVRVQVPTDNLYFCYRPSTSTSVSTRCWHTFRVCSTGQSAIITSLSWWLNFVPVALVSAHDVLSQSIARHWASRQAPCRRPTSVSRYPAAASRPSRCAVLRSL